MGTIRRRRCGYGGTGVEVVLTLDQKWLSTKCELALRPVAIALLM
jgi:hypothetical protein